MIFEQESPPAAEMMEDPDDQSDALSYIRDAANKDDPYLFAARGSAYTNVLFVHGCQTHAYSLRNERVEDVRDSDADETLVPLNMLLSIAEGQQSFLIASGGKVMGVPTTNTDRDIEAAHYASDYVKHLYVEHDIEDMTERAANVFVETGGVYLYAGWDPSGGRMFMTQEGEEVFEGEAVSKVLSLFAVTLHPSASSYKESPYAHISEMVHRSWVEEHYPEIMRELSDTDQASLGHDGGLVFENALKVLGPAHGYYANPWSSTDMDGHPKDEGFYEVQTVYVRSCPKYPTGRMIVALARNGTAFRILADVENPYIDHSNGKRTIPLVYVPNIRVPMRALGESIIQHAIPMQQIINKHRKQILDNAELNGNPRIFKPEGIPEEAFTDEVGSIIDVPAGSSPPGYMIAPELPSYVVECEKSALQMLEILTRPTGPLRTEQQNVTSGIQQMIVEEQNKQLVAPTIKRWKNGWKAFWQLHINNFRTFAEAPIKMSVPGENDQWRESYFSGELARSNFIMDIQESNEAGTSRTAVFAEWTELLKIPNLEMMSPKLANQMWKDLGRPEIARTYRDNTVHEQKARRNIMRTRQGEVRQAEPQDDVEEHLGIYKDWMCTPEYEMEAMRDMSFGLRMGLMLQSFEMALAMKMQAQAQAQMAMAGPQGKDAGGDAGHPRMTQGKSQATPKESPPRPNAQGGGGNGFMS